MMRPILACLAIAAVASNACGSQPSPKVNTSGNARVNAPANANANATANVPLPGNALRRSRVKEVVRFGLGAFLQRIALDDEPVFVGGKFHGFRIAALAGDPSFWRGVDLKAGDVVTRVNGFPIEHPEEALEAFKSLDVASELRVDYERNGAPRELRYAIVDDEPSKAPDASAMP